MSILGPIGVDRFLSEYWQTKPLIIRNATQRFQHSLTVEELAGLSLEEDVESRLVQWHSKTDDWAVEQGPLSEERYAELPDRDWTLLVQAVDQWVPEIAEVLDQFSFLPKWRLDDVMVSYAAPGGSVGPHFDHYDVFLLQVSGTRNWRVGQRCDENSPLRVDQPLKILQTFKQVKQCILRPGDMLYLPAGRAHWGIAEDEGSITYSIGFRAPSAAELLMSAAERLAATLPEDLRYRDIGRVTGGSQIDSSVDEGLELLFKTLNKRNLLVAAKDAFISQVTEPRYIEAGELLDDEELESTLEDVRNGTALIEKSPHSRFAYSLTENDGADLFVDGVKYVVASQTAQMICDGEIETNWQNQDLINQLLKSGALIVI